MRHATSSVLLILAATITAPRVSRAQRLYAGSGPATAAYAVRPSNLMRARIGVAHARLGVARARLGPVGADARHDDNRPTLHGVAAVVRVANDWHRAIRLGDAVERRESQYNRLRVRAGLRTDEYSSPLPSAVRMHFDRIVGSVDDRLTPAQQHALVRSPEYAALERACANERQVAREVSPVMAAASPTSHSVEYSRSHGYYEAENRWMAARGEVRTTMVNALRRVAPALSREAETGSRR